mgnify:FL=1
MSGAPATSRAVERRGQWQVVVHGGLQWLGGGGQVGALGEPVTY